MSWWQAVLIATLPALVTAAGLLTQLRISQGEERRRAEDARSLAEESRIFERAAQLEDHWRDARYQAHQAFLSVAEEVYGALSDLVLQFRYESEEEAALVIAGPNANVDAPTITRLFQALGALNLLASSTAYDAANALAAKLREANLWLWVSAVRGSVEDPALRLDGWSKGEIVNELALSAAMLRAYRDNARTDLGTDSIARPRQTDDR